MKRIVLKNVSKKFLVKASPGHSSGNHIFKIFSKKECRWALKNVSLTVNPGEIIGVVGLNGAGKSTLLSVISGVYKNDSGDLSVNGRAVSVIGLTSGLKDRLSARDNIYLCGALYGLTKNEIKKQEQSVYSFAGLEKYRDAKLQQFSTGMIARLVFSIAIHCHPDILLLDEINSNLDKEFTKILNDEVSRYKKRGGAAVIVSHKQQVIRGCDRVLWLENGKKMMEGTSQEVIKRYWGA